MSSYTKFDLTVDEGNGGLNPSDSRDKKIGQAPQKEGGELNEQNIKSPVWPSSCVTPAGTSTYYSYTERCM